MSELKSGVILARNRSGRGFVWRLDQDLVEEIDLRNIIEVSPDWFEPFLRVGFANGLSTAELEGQWIDRQLVVRLHGSDTPIYWEDDNVGELLSASRQIIFGVKAGRRVKFLELVCA